MNILVTGAVGFVGQHLMQHLRDTYPKARLHGVVIAPPGDGALPANYHTLDLRDPAAVAALIDGISFTHVYHLAAQANVARSHDHPWETLENNIRMQVNLLEAIRHAGAPARLLIISSGEVYGTDANSVAPPDENAPLRPTSPYSVSKVAQDLLGLQYHLAHQLPIMRARPFNHLGPGQALGFVAPDFAMQVARIEAGLQEPVMRVGSLDSERDFTDVRDIVRAYQLIMDYGVPGEAYNVASGHTHRIGEILEILCSLATTPISVSQDPARIRPGKTGKSWGDAAKLRESLGWSPQVPLESTLADVLNDWRARVKLEQLT